jgi:hypothetical protein
MWGNTTCFTEIRSCFFEEGVSEFGSTKLVTHRTETGNAMLIRKALCVEAGNGE